MAHPFNASVASKLGEVADILEGQGANPFRIRSYRQAAETVRGLPRPVHQILRDEGAAGLERLPGIGERLARALRDIVATGRLPMLDRLRGEADPREILATVPGIGRITAERLHRDLEIDSLEELEAAAHDGRLASIEGIGSKRLAGIRDSLAHRLGRPRPRAEMEPSPGAPSVEELLDVDCEYRRLADAGKLKRIAPRRFNPEAKTWLPILHTRRGARHYTVLYSNTPRAHELGRTHDWVVVYHDGLADEGQATIVTARSGPLAGRRIVRGRERECLGLAPAAPDVPRAPSPPPASGSERVA